MKVITIKGADIYRDGGSYGFWFDSDDGNSYEFFIKSRRLEKDPDTDYYTPVIYLKGCDGKSIVKSLSWLEAQEFIKPLSYDAARFRELVKVVNGNGKGLWNT